LIQAIHIKSKASIRENNAKNEGEYMKRVLIVSQHFPPERSGCASRIHDMAVHLSSMGIDVSVISPHPTFPYGEFRRTWTPSTTQSIEGITLVNLWSMQPTSKDPGFISRTLYFLIFPLHVAVWTLFHLRTFDVIITSDPPIFTHIPGIIMKKLFKKSWIIEVRDLWIDASISLGFLKKGSLYEKMARKFVNICLRNADQIGVTTHELGKRLSHDEAIQKKIVWLPNGVDTERFHPFNNAKKDQIIYAGNVGHAQDLEKVILAIKEVNKKFSLRFNIVGDGDINERLKDLVKSEGIEDVVIFTGVIAREKIPMMLSESLIGVAPLKKLETLEYAAPTKVYEYMACGIPFLGCGNGEIANIAQESGAGVIADNTPNSIAYALQDLLNDPQKMEVMGQHGREYVQKYYDRRAIAAKLKENIRRDVCKVT